jgi:signal transduction histidine kinase
MTTPGLAEYRLPLEEPAAEAAPTHCAAGYGDDQVWLGNVYWFCTLRWLVVAVLFGFGMAGAIAANLLRQWGICLAAGWPTIIAAGLAALNLLYLAMARDAARSPGPRRIALRCLWLQIMLDLAVLTVVIHYMGSLDSLAPTMYLFHIVLACIFFPSRQSLVVTLSAMGMLLACVAAETAGVLGPASLVVGSVPCSAMPWAVLCLHFGSVVFVSGTVWYLASRLARALRDREAELATTNHRLVAATEERARHMLRTTHQLKAPFAGIHANAQLLLGGYCGPISDRVVAVAAQISNRCETLSREIKEMLQLANLRSAAQPAPPPAPVDLAVLIGAALANLRLPATRRGISIKEDVSPAPVPVIPDHAVMIIDNVLANALAYSRDGGKVSVSCHPRSDGGATIVVCDTGIGIPAEKLPRIFEDYFRTAEAATHNRASTGLGLAIVREAARAGKIAVCVQSAVGHGTTVTLDFPATIPN